MSRTFGKKEKWQEYPCIIAHSPDYALIAYSEDKGKIIDTEGRTVEELEGRDERGYPLMCFIRKKYRDLTFLSWGQCSRYRAEYIFWQSKYPELLTKEAMPRDGE